MASLVKAHYISVPMLATCCGVSACYDCLKEVISAQFKAHVKRRQAEAEKAEAKLKQLEEAEGSKDDKVAENVEPESKKDDEAA